jgi:hypothetical protein
MHDEGALARHAKMRSGSAIVLSQVRESHGLLVFTRQIYLSDVTHQTLPVKEKKLTF